MRIFLLDDHELVRRGVRDLLWSHDDMTVVGEASTAEEALRQIPQLQPRRGRARRPPARGPISQVGYRCAPRIRSTHPEVACAMLTSFADDEALLASIMAGAAGYVLKHIHGTDLVSAVRRVAAGESLLDPAITARVLERLRSPATSRGPSCSSDSAGARILDFIAEGRTNRQIAGAMFLAERTVKNYVSHLLAKLGMQRRTQAAAFAARLAERREHDPPEK